MMPQSDAWSQLPAILPALISAGTYFAGAHFAGAAAISLR
jgi:hypothetical protein